MNDNGVVYCLDLNTGSILHEPMRLAPGTYSSSTVWQSLRPIDPTPVGDRTATDATVLKTVGDLLWGAV